MKIFEEVTQAMHIEINLRQDSKAVLGHALGADYMAFFSTLGLNSALLNGLKFQPWLQYKSLIKSNA